MSANAQEMTAVTLASGRNLNCWKLLEGADRRVSISKFLWLVWIVVIVCCYTTLFVLHVKARDYSVTRRIPANLLIVYCFSTGTAAAEKVITNARIRRNRLWIATPVDSSGSRVLSNLFQDETGRLDPAKVQMTSFTLAAAIYFVGIFGRQIASNPTSAGLPDLNTSLMILIGISQASYLGRKFVTAASPILNAARSPWAVAGADAWLILVGITLGFVQNFGTDFVKDAVQLLFWFEVFALIVFDFTGLVAGSQALTRDGRNLADVIPGAVRAWIYNHSSYSHGGEAEPSSADGKAGGFGLRRSSVVPPRIRAETWSVMGPAGYPMNDAGFQAQITTWRPRIRRAAIVGVAFVAVALSGVATALASEAAILGAAVSLGVLTITIVALQGEVPVSGWRLHPQSGAQAVDVWEQVVDVVETESAAGMLHVRTRPSDTSATVGVPAEDRVNVGVVRASRPGTPISKGPLAAGEDHLVWVGIGPSDPDAVPGEGHPLDLSKIETGQRLDVVLFTDDALLVPDAPRAGSFVMGQDRPLRVRGPAERPLVTEVLATTRLYFRVRTPPLSGHYKVRVCVYYRNTLLQVRQVSLPVGRSRAQLVSLTPYAIVRSPSARGVTELAERRLSLYINESGDGSHDLWVRGQAGQKARQWAGHLDEGEVGRLTRLVRDALRQVSWGTTTENAGEHNLYPPGESGRFDVNFEKLKADLIILARHGYVAWDLIIDKLGRGSQQDLQVLMRQRGIIEIAPRTNSSVIPPVAALYDLNLDTEAEVSDLSLCPEVEKALLDGSDLAVTRCFTDRCEHASGNDLVVCPSGFWGLRHDIAVPLSHEAAPDLAPRLRLGFGSPGAILVGTVPESVVPEVTGHAEKVAGRFGSSDHVVGRADWFTKAEVERHYAVLYFLCHGEEKPNGSVLVLDRPGRPGISRSNLRTKKVSLDHNPLVVMNACNTGALTPDKAINLVSGFTSRGAGAIIGTEITIFPSLAYAFADTFMNAFVGTSPDQPTMVGIGSAVRAARLELLRQWNPLGLAYVLYGLADATLVAPAW
jgi:hypothetical protein